jgi:predicted transcriptional regulator
MAFTKEELFRKDAHVWDGVPVEKGVKSIPLNDLIFLLSGNDLKLLLILENMMDADNCTKASVRELANIVGISPMTAQKSLNGLLDISHKGIPLVEKLEGTGKNSNIYRITDIKK